MGVDLGLRYIAVASVGTKSWFSKGNQCTFVGRRYAALRRTLGKAKKLHMIRKIGDRKGDERDTCSWMSFVSKTEKAGEKRLCLPNGWSSSGNKSRFYKTSQFKKSWF
jgi:hypothetical protein